MISCFCFFYKKKLSKPQVFTLPIRPFTCISSVTTHIMSKLINKHTISQGRFFCKLKHPCVFLQIFRKSVEFCNEHEIWKLNVAHVLFMQVSIAAYIANNDLDKLDETDSVLSFLHFFFNRKINTKKLLVFMSQS